MHRTQTNRHDTPFHRAMPHSGLSESPYSKVPVPEADKMAIVEAEKQEAKLLSRIFNVAKNLTSANTGANVGIDPNLPDLMEVTPTGRPGELAAGIKVSPKDSKNLRVEFKFDFFTSEGTVIRSRVAGDDTEEGWVVRQGVKDVPKVYLDSIFKADRLLREQQAAQKGKSVWKRLTGR